MFRTVSCLSLFLLSTITAAAQMPQAPFQPFTLKDVGSISIPGTMMLQAPGAQSAPSETVFQQKPAAEIKVTTYARVMVDTWISKPGTYRKLAVKISSTPAQIRALDTSTKNDTTNAFEGTGLRIIRWDGVSVVTLNGRSAVRTAYLRQLNQNPPVYVELFEIHNNDRVHMLTVSYRDQDAALWKSALEHTKNSLTITNIR